MSQFFNLNTMCLLVLLILYYLFIQFYWILIFFFFSSIVFFTVLFEKNNFLTMNSLIVFFTCIIIHLNMTCHMNFYQENFGYKGDSLINHKFYCSCLNWLLILGRFNGRKIINIFINDYEPTYNIITHHLQFQVFLLINL